VKLRITQSEIDAVITATMYTCMAIVQTGGDLLRPILTTKTKTKMIEKLELKSCLELKYH